MKKTTTSLLVVLSGMVAVGMAMAPGLMQNAVAQQTTAGSSATGEGSASTGSGAATASIGPLPVLGTVTASGSGSSSTGSTNPTAGSGGVVALCSGFDLAAIGGGCTFSAP